MTSDRIPVERNVMIWARESVRLDQKTAAKKLGVSLATLQRWEKGYAEKDQTRMEIDNGDEKENSPTIKQLRKAAKVYKWPLAVLLLPEPPEDYKTLLDYRSSEAIRSTDFSYKLTTEIRRAHMQREVLLEIQEFAPESAPEVVPIPDISRINDAEQIGELLRKYIGFDEDTPKSTGDGSDSLRDWISAIEKCGILVLYLRDVETEEIEGFSISTFPYPVITANGKSLPRRRLFTLLHELAHIAINQSDHGSICDLGEVASNNKAKRAKLEIRCNEIAAAIALPAQRVVNAFRESNLGKNGHLDTELLWKISKPFGVSSEAFLRRLVSLNLTPMSNYWDTRQKLLKLYDKAKKEKRQREKETTGGPSSYNLKARTLGHMYVESVLDAYATHAISPIDAANFLELKYDQIAKLSAEVK